MQYRPEIDGLRALAVLPVILFHAGFGTFHGGYVGVDVFFVISGYLITSIILADLKRGQFSLPRFYERRARRILPALFLVILACIPAALFILMPFALEDFFQSIVAVSTFSSNFFFWLKSDYFSNAAELRPLLHTWSLAVEEQYYVLFPLFLLLMWRYFKAWIFLLLGAAFLLSLGFSQWSAFNEPIANFYLLPTRAWELLIGVFSAFYLNSRKAGWPDHLSQVASFLGLAMIAFAVFAFDARTPFPSLYALLPTLGTALIILSESKTSWAYRILSQRALVGIGLISYSAYLWHQPLLAFAKYRSPGEPSVALIASLCVLTLPLAYLSWRFVEVPFRRRDRVSAKHFAVGFSTLAVALCAVGLVGHFTNGFPSLMAKRYEEPVRSVALQFINARGYQSRRWRDELKFRGFDENKEKINVLIIGDSYARDIANAIYESDLSELVYVSGYHISRFCGNVWTDEDLSGHIDVTHKDACIAHKRYDHPRLQMLMSSADEIWLVSSWQEWHIRYLPETIKRIERASDARLRVFGTKGLDTPVSFYNYLDATKRGSIPYEAAINGKKTKINERIKGVIDKAEFVDLFEILCPVRPVCPNTTDDGLIIFFDRGHLTKEGAHYLGTKLKHRLYPMIASHQGS